MRLRDMTKFTSMIRDFSSVRDPVFSWDGQIFNLRGKRSQVASREDPQNASPVTVENCVQFLLTEMVQSYLINEFAREFAGPLEKIARDEASGTTVSRKSRPESRRPYRNCIKSALNEQQAPLDVLAQTSTSITSRDRWPDHRIDRANESRIGDIAGST